MENFKNCLLRLKEQLGVEMDKDIASLLGLQTRAMTARKRRDSFPVKELEALAASRPDLGIDVRYVLTGQSAERPFADMGERLVGERLRLGMPVQYMAEKGGVSAKQQREFEEGRKRPPAGYLNRLSSLGLEAHWVLTGSEEDDAIRDKERFPYTPEIREFIEHYLLCSPATQEALRTLAKDGAGQRWAKIEAAKQAQPSASKPSAAPKVLVQHANIGNMEDNHAPITINMGNNHGSENNKS
jgi:transcriptional regulator with XRE-family HTH domain